ncbi:MAG: tRNA epoxyqueuosine(34) reductase QueG [Alphaproteobacteria bacterium]|nr:tRNA epoxyqueuosine(34) reductase QueG [Alphaproteobacteria bacterium]
MSKTQPDPTGAATKEAIRRLAQTLGIDALGVAPPDLDPAVSARLSEFLAAGRHGEMSWLAERRIERASPRALWPAANAVIMAGMNYGPDTDPRLALRNGSRGAISVYAHGRDYHDVFKKRLKALARSIVATYGGEVKVFVDTAPVMEKPLGQAAGVGWQGKHTNLVSREFGSWLFLGAIYTTLKLPADPPEIDHCGACVRCLEICPTDAFPAPYQLDARRCIAYLTIEHKGSIPRDLRAGIGNRIFGCDDCLAVCPWNKFASVASEAKLRAREHATPERLDQLACLDEETFRRTFAGSPIKRTGRDRFVRNVMIAIGNSGDPALLDAARRGLDDASPLVRGAATWAFRRLAPVAETNREAAARQRTEPDPEVREEWLERQS